MDDKELISQLRAALSWAVAPMADNPAFQAVLEQERRKDPLHHINQLGSNDSRYRHLFANDDMLKIHGRDGRPSQLDRGLRHEAAAQRAAVKQRHAAVGPAQRPGERESSGVRLALIAAVARNGVIGRDNAMAWELPEDMRHFRRVTMGHPVVMGRRTWDSLPKSFRPLPGRRNVVVTRNPNWSAEGAEVAGSLEEALQRLVPAWTPVADQLPDLDGQEVSVISPGAARRKLWFARWRAEQRHFELEDGWFNLDEVTYWRPAGPSATVFLMGGAQLYAQALPYADELVLTELDQDFEGDVCFPAFDRSHFVEVKRETYRASPPNDFNISFVTYQRRQG